MSYLTFVNPRTIHHGPGAVESLSAIPAQRALVVTDPGVRDLGIIDRVEKILSSRNVEVLVFDQVEPDPSRETAYKIFLMAQDFKPDVFIGLGGGSSIDAGKAAWVFYEHPDIAEMHLFDVQKEVPARVLRKKARYIAIPTTSGTGSEVTGVRYYRPGHKTAPKGRLRVPGAETGYRDCRPGTGSFHAAYGNGQHRVRCTGSRHRMLCVDAAV